MQEVLGEGEVECGSWRERTRRHVSTCDFQDVVVLVDMSGLRTMLNIQMVKHFLGLSP